MTQLFADFNAIDEDGRIWLPSAETAQVARGDLVILTDGDVEVVAQLSYDYGRRVWLGQPDRSTLRTVTSGAGIPSASS
jgi:hypothetical protein